ncbi:hypothetical protein [Gorillibacterium massiliense]|uniref:hypothetical protein n=1 Tax=Gorillibacterium massiliense TaxID=1280390 RepID=UPI0004B40133|nr:hypothetical protein [Gorillibacterium massiliense]
MITNTQKKFKREMKKLAKERSANSERQAVYSYMEDQFTDGSPVIARRRGFKGWWVVSLVVFGALGTAGYFAEHDRSGISHTNGVLAMMLRGTFPRNSTDEGVKRYLDQTKEQDARMMNVLNDALAIYGDAMSGTGERSASVSQIQSKQQEARTLLANEISTKDVPDGLSDYRSTLMSKYNTVLNVLAYAVQSIQDGDEEKDRQLRDLVDHYNVLSSQQLVQLTGDFDEMGIKWKKTETGIEYRMNVRNP